MTDCSYRTPLSLYPSLDLSAKSYADMSTFSMNWSPTVYNDWVWYKGLTQSSPPARTAPYHIDMDVLRFGPSNRGLVQMMFREKTVQPNEAVILVHGSSVTPYWWFNEAAQSYLNAVGQSIFNDGFDCYAPYVVHDNKFLNRRARIADTVGEKMSELDVQRVIAVANNLKAKGYTKIHFVGVSYGGMVAMRARKSFGTDSQMGMTLLIEGWYPTAKTIKDANVPLDSTAYEMVYHGSITQAEHDDLPAGTYLAYGSCSVGGDFDYATAYSGFPSSKIIAYTGAHEVLKSVWDTALARYRS